MNPIARLLTPAAAALVLLAAPHSALAACPGADAVPTAATAMPAAGAVHCLVNVARTARGLRPLRGDRRLRRAGRSHAADMVRSRFFSHTSLDGRGPAARAARAGAGRAGMRLIGENLAWATDQRATPRGVVERWLESPPHRATMLDRRFRAMGSATLAGTPRPEHPVGFTFATVFGG